MDQVTQERLGVYTIDQLGRDVDAIVARADGQLAIAKGVAPLLTQFLSRGEKIPEDFCTANDAGSGPEGMESLTEEQRIMREVKVTRLYKGAGGKFVIMAAVWPVGCRTGAHDHNGTWVVEGGYRNRLLLKAYERLDDRSMPGHAELREVYSGVVKPGDVGYVVSPDKEIHDYSNPYDVAAVTINIYGSPDPNNEVCGYYDIESNTYNRVTPFDVPYYEDVIASRAV